VDFVGGEEAELPEELAAAEAEFGQGADGDEVLGHRAG
jgi:hypothetical protein